MYRSSLVRLSSLLMGFKHLLKLLLAKGAWLFYGLISFPLLVCVLVLFAKPREMVVHDRVLWCSGSSQVRLGALMVDELALIKCAVSQCV